jgi:Raf kinase inhibitor-like YbhB/YbcL family protein
MGCGANDDGRTEPDAEPSSNVQPGSSSDEQQQENVNDTTMNEGGQEMIIKSSGISDGVIDPKYGKNGDVQENGIPTLSIPLEIENAPEGTVCFAIYMDDPDAKPLAGYNWVHWTAVNIPESSMPENYSKDGAKSIVQGTTDYGTVGYGGPAPPDKDHTYVIVVYALDATVDLEDGFDKTAFYDAIEGHVLTSATLEAVYKK